MNIILLLSLSAPVLSLLPSSTQPINSLYLYSFPQPPLNYLAPYSPPSFYFQLSNPKTQTLIHFMLTLVDEGTTLISYGRTLGIEEIAVGKKIDEKGKVKIIKEDIGEYEIMRKNLYLNDMEDYSSIFNMKMSNFSCLTNNSYQHSFYSFVNKIALFSSQNLILLDLPSEKGILDDLLRLVEEGSGQFVIIFTRSLNL